MRFHAPRDAGRFDVAALRPLPILGRRRIRRKIQALWAAVVETLEKRLMMTSAAANIASANYTFDNNTHAPGVNADSNISWWSSHNILNAYDNADDGYITATNGGSLKLSVNGSSNSAPGDYTFHVRMYILNNQGTYLDHTTPGHYQLQVSENDTPIDALEQSGDLSEIEYGRVARNLDDDHEFSSCHYNTADTQYGLTIKLHHTTSTRVAFTLTASNLAAGGSTATPSWGIGEADVSIQPEPQKCNCRTETKQNGKTNTPTPSVGSGRARSPGGGSISNHPTAGHVTDSGGNTAGNHVVPDSQPFLLQMGNNVVIAVDDGANSRWFDLAYSGDYVERYGLHDLLTHDTTNHRYVIISQDGTKSLYYDFNAANADAQQGRIKEIDEPTGAVTSYTYSGSATNLAEVVTAEDSGSNHSKQSFLYSYLSVGANAGKIESVEYRTKGWIGGSEPTFYTPVQKLEYSYYDGSSGTANGSLGDLQTVKVLDAGPEVSVAVGTASSSLSSGTTYYYEVTGVTPLGEGNPSLLKNAVITAVSQVANLTWSAYPGATGYKVYRGTTSASLVLLTTLGNTTSYTDNGSASPGASVPPHNILNSSYYRYYTNGAALGDLKYEVRPASFDRMVGQGIDPTTATNGQLDTYAEEYYEYDSSERVSKRISQGEGCSTCSGGRGSYTYAYVSSNFGSDSVAVWQDKTTEVLPDGNQDVTYYNDQGEELLDVQQELDSSKTISKFERLGTTATVTSTGHGYAVNDVVVVRGSSYSQYNGIFTITGVTSNTFTYTMKGNPGSDETSPSGATVRKMLHQLGAFSRYDTQGQIIWYAHSSALALPANLDSLDSNPDLLQADSNGHFTYLQDDKGLIDRTVYYDSTNAGDPDASGNPGGVDGYIHQLGIQNGQDGDLIVQTEFEYYQHPNGLSGTNAATIYPLADIKTFPDATDDMIYRTTSYSRTWYSNSVQMKTEAITRPSIGSSQNGNSGTETDTTYYDAMGDPIWTRDADGAITYISYDPATGAVLRTITDVAWADLTSDEKSLYPSGWDTNRAGVHLVTTMAVDAQGRTTEITDPRENATAGTGNVTYIVYDDPDHEVRSYSGFDGTNTTGPIQISREDRAGSYTEDLSIAVSPHLTGGVPDGSESFSTSNIRTLSRTHTSDGGQVDESLRFVSFSGGITYAMGAGSLELSGTSGTNFYKTTFGYDTNGQQNKIVNAVGTITRTVYDAFRRPSSVWMGTSDASWTPTNAASMTKFASYLYDTYDPAIFVAGDSNLTRVTTYPTGTNSVRVEETYYDWRDRPVASKSGVLLNGSSQDDPASETNSASVQRLIIYNTYDNLDEVTRTNQYDGDGAIMVTSNAPTDTLGGADGVPDAPGTNTLRASIVTHYDDQGRVFETDVLDINQSTGAEITNATSGTNTLSLKTWNWYDHRGNLIKTATPGGLVAKYTYDGAGRVIKQFTTDGGGDSTWDNAGTLDGNYVFEQTEYQYDANSNVIFSINKLHFHDDTNTGELSSVSGTPKARVMYNAFYYDRGDRLTASVDVGTNGGSTYSRPGSAPARSSTVLVTSYAYNDAGWQSSITDPRGLTNTASYDLLGRTTETISNYRNGISGDGSAADDDQIVDYTYDGNDNVLTMKAVVGSTGTNINNVFQKTQYVYGTTNTAGSDLNSNDLLAQIIYPDKSLGTASTNTADIEAFTYNALGQQKTLADRNGNVHTYGYDVLGRLTSDSVTTLGTISDGGTLRMDYKFDTAGRPYQMTSYSNTAGSGTPLNQVQYAYNGYGQLITEYQAHSGAVDVNSTPKVQYGYNEGGDRPNDSNNNSRLIRIVYPNGRVVRYEYGTSSSMDYKISRLAFLADDAAGTIGPHIEEYQYLGLSTVVIRNRPNGNSSLTYVKQSSDTISGDGGDQYIGLDRFNRIVDQRWLSQTSGSTTTLDRFQYNYDQNSNPLYKENLVSSTFSELYHLNGATNGLDGLNRLTDMRRGTLSDANSDGVKDTVTTANTLSGSVKDWSLDAVGNWNSSTNGASATARTNNLQNQATNVGGVTLTYDNAGNTTKDETSKTYTYDAWNRMIASKSSGGSTIQTYSYDALGRRTKENTGTSLDLYYSAGWQVLEEVPACSCGVTTGQSQYVWSPFYVDELIERDRDVDQSLDGALDSSFGGTGKITTTIGSGGGPARAVAIQSDGKTVAAGYAQPSSGDFAFAIARYDTAGALDTSFGSGGKVTVDVASGSDFAYAEAIQSDGKIVVVGSTGSNMAVVRLTATGALDTTFNTTGKVTTAFGTGSDTAIAYSVAIQSDGKIVVGGYAHIAADGHNEFAVARYNTDGSLDTTFGTGGKDTLYDAANSLDDKAFAMAIGDDGKIVVGGQENNDLALGRFNADGTADTANFDGDGIATTSISGTQQINGLVVQSDGSIVVAGTSGTDFIIAKFLTGGSLDTTFGSSSGYTITDFTGTDAGYAIARQADGKFIAAGMSNFGDFAVGRYTSAGILDTTFNSTGKVTTDFGGTDTAYALAIGPDYKVTVAGLSAGGFALARYKVTSGLEERIYVETDANHDVTSISNVFGSVQERFVYDPYGSSTVLNSSFVSTSDTLSWVYRDQTLRFDSVNNLEDERNRVRSVTLGRPMQNDPSGYPDGPNRYLDRLSNPLAFLDPLGNSAIPEDEMRRRQAEERDEAIRRREIEDFLATPEGQLFQKQMAELNKKIQEEAERERLRMSGNQLCQMGPRTARQQRIDDLLGIQQGLAGGPWASHFHGKLEDELNRLLEEERNKDVGLVEQLWNTAVDVAPDIAAGIVGLANRGGTGPTQSNTRGQGVARSGPRGVDPDHHNANITQRNAEGDIVSHGRMISGNMTPEERALGYPKGPNASHTEPRGLKSLNLTPRDIITITGQLEPCPTCKGYMNKCSIDSNVRIIYRWRENGKTMTWEATQVSPADR